MEALETLYRCCAGLDVHQKQVAACVRVTRLEGNVNAFTMRFDATPVGLKALRDWLASHQVTHAAMEGTGVYWIPVYRALREGNFDLTLCNAHHVKKVQGRKSDQSDAAWLAQLLAAGLLKKSFVPTEHLCGLRELTRARVHRVEDRARVVNGIHRLLERIGLKLCSVVSDLQGVTARAILTDLADGVADPEAMAAHARGTLKSKRAQLEAVLQARVNPVERMMLGQQLTLLNLLDQQIADLETRIRTEVEPYDAQIKILMSVRGIEFIAATAILAEIGPDMTVFKGSNGLAAWAGLAPGQNESAGKRKRAQTPAGNRYLTRITVQVALVISRLKKPHDLTDFFRKKMPALGYKKALVATAHKLIVRLWRMLTDGKAYAPPPPPPLTEKQRARRSKRYSDLLEKLGYTVTLERKAA